MSKNSLNTRVTMRVIVRVGITLHFRYILSQKFIEKAANCTCQIIFLFETTGAYMSIRYISELDLCVNINAVLGLSKISILTSLARALATELFIEPFNLRLKLQGADLMSTCSFSNSVICLNEHLMTGGKAIHAHILNILLSCMGQCLILIS